MLFRRPMGQNTWRCPPPVGAAPASRRAGRQSRLLRLAWTLIVCVVAVASLAGQHAMAIQAAEQGWHGGVPMQDGRRYPVAATGADGRIYVFGGFGQPVPGIAHIPILQSVEAYDPTTGTWSGRAPLSSARVQMAAVAGADGRIYLFGGNSGHGFLNSVSIYDPVTNSWTSGARMPTARERLAAATGPDGKIYVMGGYDRVGARRKLEIYDPRTNAWTVGTPMPIGGYGLGAATARDGKIYAIGGYRRNFGDPALHIGGTLPYVQIYDPASATWTLKESFPTPRLSLGVVRGNDGRIYAIGGTHPFAGALNVAEAFNPSTGRWSTLPPMPTGRADLATAVAPDGSIYAIGGYDGHRTFLNSVDVLSP